MDENNPLNCLRCNSIIKNPVRLSCLHYFCRTCVDTGKCHVCGRTINSTEIIEDKVLSYVIESSQETTETCANCDQISQPMFFCKTCQRPLCAECREITHKAKIFHFHNIVQLEERGRIRNPPLCTKHGAPYILFCLDSKSLMCTQCFNSTSLERRGHFVNIDVAHKICCEKLEKSAMNLRTFQNDLKEQIELCKRLIVELEKNETQMSKEIKKKCEEIIKHVNLLKKQLIENLMKEKIDKEKQITSQLTQLKYLENPVGVNLLSISIFCSYASKIDMLFCYADLFRSVQQFISSNGRFIQKVKFDCGLSVNFPSEFNEIICQLMGLQPKTTPENSVFFCNNSLVSNQTVDTTRSNNPENKISSSDFLNKNPFSNNESFDVIIAGESFLTPSKILFNDMAIAYSFSTNFESINSMDQHFLEKFQQIVHPLRIFAQEFSLISKGLLDLQKDITLRRCVVNGEELLNRISRCEDAWNRLEKHNTNVQKILNHYMTQLWRKEIERVQRQQSIVRDKIEEMKQLRLMAQRALKVSQQLKPFAAQMAKLISVIDSRRSGSVTPSPMEKICLEISQIEPDSQSRIAAIEKEEKTRRLTKLEEEKTQMALKEAVKTKKNLKEVKAVTSKPKRPIVIHGLNRDRSIIQEKYIKKRLELQRNSEDEMSKKIANNSTLPLITSESQTSEKTDITISNKFIEEAKDESMQKSEELCPDVIAAMSSTMSQEMKNSGNEKSELYEIPRPPDQPVPTLRTSENSNNIRLQSYNRDPAVLQVREKLLASIREKVKRID